MGKGGKEGAHHMPQSSWIIILRSFLVERSQMSILVNPAASN